MGKRLKLFLDSGAYSAWSRGETIGLKEYMAFIRKTEPLLSEYVTLDYIPGIRGQSTTHADFEKSAQKSYRNHQIMRDAGLKPVPVFHYGESRYWLEKYVMDGERYIGLSPPAKIPTKRLLPWLQSCFSVLTDAQGRPLVRTHSFGNTQAGALRRFPFTTADSTSWATLAGYGCILVPGYRDGVADYAARHLVVCVSGEVAPTTPSRKMYGKEGDIFRAHVDRFLEQEVGCTIGHVCNSNEWRCRALIAFYKGIERAVRINQVRAINHGDLFYVHAKNSKAVVTPPFEMIMASMTDVTKNRILSSLDMQHRLLSFYFVGNVPYDELAHLVETGMPVVKRKRRPPRRGKAFLALQAIASIERALLPLEDDDEECQEY